MSKDVGDWFFRLQSQNILVSSECLAANLKKVRQTSVWQMVPKFWIIWLWYISFCITYKSKSLRNNKKDKEKLWNYLSYRGLPYFLRLATKISELAKKFGGRSPKIQPRMSFDLNGFKNGPSKHFERTLKSMHFFQRLIGDRTKTNFPKQWGL